MLSSGITYSSTSLRGSPRAVPCLAVEGIASSKMAPLSVVSYKENESLNIDFILFWGLYLAFPRKQVQGE